MGQREKILVAGFWLLVAAVLLIRIVAQSLKSFCRSVALSCSCAVVVSGFIFNLKTFYPIFINLK